MSRMICKRLWYLLSFLLLAALVFHTNTVSAKMKLNLKKVMMTTGEKKKLKVVGTDKKVKWKSANKKVAAVNAKGIVKAEKAGKTKIKAIVDGRTLQCVVTVKKAGSSVPERTTIQESTNDDGWSDLIPFK
ncbi:MAG: Ig domain-containing protein [Lachnospiraceae bacterium]